MIAETDLQTSLTFIIIIVVIVHSIGAASELSDIIACIGVSFRQFCSVDSRIHIWMIGAMERSIGVGTKQGIVVMGFTLRLVGVGTAITSSVSGTVTPDKNNTMIVCRDGNFPIGQGDTQEARVMVFGKCLFGTIS